VADGLRDGDEGFIALASHFNAGQYPELRQKARQLLGTLPAFH